MANVVVSAIATFNGKALKKGQKDISAFDKQAQKLGRTFSRVFAATTIIAFSKRAINAFAADEKAAKSLAVQLENTGNAFRVGEVETYIAGLQKLYGILDDQLRPAFQTLLNATGSVTLSQQALETALNVSAGTGKDLATVVAAIAKGASGTTTSLARLGTGLDKATIASGDMNKIMAALDAKFKGQALARLETYSGKMDLLKVATANATETIGKGLVDALTTLSRDNSIENLSTDFENLANNIATVITELAKLTDKIGNVVNNPSFKPALLLLAFASKNPTAIKAAFAYVGITGVAELATTKFDKSTSLSKNVGGYSGIPLLKAENKAIKDAIYYRKQENSLLKAKTAVDQLRDKFDVERIGLMAALNAATDEETKLRIRAQIAILDNNDALAKKILAEMAAADAAKKFAENFQFALDAVKLMTAKINAFILSMGGKIPTLTSDMIEPGPSFAPLTADYFQELATQLVGTSSYAGMNVAQIATERARESGNRSVDVNITIDSPSGDKFAQLIAESIQVAGRSGYSTTGAGQLP